MKMYNIFDKLVFFKDREIEETIFENEKIRLVRTASLGQSTDYYDQEELEIVKIEEGSARLEIEGEIVDLKKGDILEIYPHQIHKIISQEKMFGFVYL